MKAFVNGRFVAMAEATISIHDAGLQHAVGLFETMQAFNGRVFRLEAHVERLVASAKELGLSASLRADPLCECVEATLRENDRAEARLRLTVTGGDLSLLGAARSGGGKQPPHTPTVLCVATEPTQYPPSFFASGVTVTIADGRANPFDPGEGHKTLHYWPRLRALASAAAAGAGEALWLSVTNHLVGGSVSNALLVKDGQLLTPYARGEEEAAALPAPVLPGVTRAAVIELAEELDIAVHRRMLDIEDVLGADEMMLTNSSWQVLPVVAVEKGKVGTGEPGPITLKLREALLDRIAAETGEGEADG